MRFNITKRPKQSLVERAKREYRNVEGDSRYKVFAYLVAQGQSPTTAYRQISVNAGERTAQTRSSLLLAHPIVRQWVSDHMIGGRNIAASEVPDGVRELVNIRDKDNADKSDAVKIKAIDSILDRGGLPRSKEIAISATGMAEDLTGRIGSGDDVIEGEVLEEGPDHLTDKQIQWSEYEPASDT